jgi:hypothetical protein
MATFGPCCLCGRDIEPRDPDPCRITVETAGGQWQVWFCHAECFKERLTTPPGFPDGFFDPAHF